MSYPRLAGFACQALVVVAYAEMSYAGLTRGVPFPQRHFSKGIAGTGSSPVTAIPVERSGVPSEFGWIAVFSKPRFRDKDEARDIEREGYGACHDRPAFYDIR